jgi:hypothetical protein
MNWKTCSDKQDMMPKVLIGTIIRLNIRGSVIKKISVDAISPIDGSLPLKMIYTITDRLFEYLKSNRKVCQNTRIICHTTKITFINRKESI